MADMLEFSSARSSSGFASASFAQRGADYFGLAALAGIDGIFEIGRGLGGRDKAEDQPPGANRAGHDQGR
jgi:hypothetical protein